MHQQYKHSLKDTSNHKSVLSTKLKFSQLPIQSSVSSLIHLGYQKRIHSVSSTKLHSLWLQTGKNFRHWLHVALVVCLFVLGLVALMSLTNLKHFLIYTLSFWVQRLSAGCVLRRWQQSRKIKARNKTGRQCAHCKLHQSLFTRHLFHIM
jgi:hypothetical protein